jgi:hypothetical protein
MLPHPVWMNNLSILLLFFLKTGPLHHDPYELH